jgi:hypothetical protein
MTHITQIKKRALLAAAAAAKLSTTSFQSNAAIIYTDIADQQVVNSVFSVDIDGGGYDLSFIHGMAIDSGFLDGSASISAESGVNMGLVAVGDSVNGGFSPTSIDLARLFKGTDAVTYNSYQDIDGLFSAGGSGYLGFTLGSGNNGWLGFDVAPFGVTISSNAITVKDYAYEDSGSAIEAGAKTSTDVPEPATWAIFALGAYFVSRRMIKAA